MNKTTGSTVSSFAVTAAGGGYLLDCGFNGEYYFAAGGNSHGAFNLYTTRGVSAGAWTAAGAVGILSTGGHDAVERVNNNRGSYYCIMSWDEGDTNFIVNYPEGSAVASWAHTRPPANANGLMCGAGWPANYTPSCWANMYDGMNVVIYQVSLGNDSTAVTPASLGQVKALYR